MHNSFKMAALAIAGCWLFVLPAQGVQYAITDLGSLSEYGSTGLGVNTSGQVVGYAIMPSMYSEPYDSAFLYSDGAMRSLGAGKNSWAVGINASGQVVGQGEKNGSMRGFLYDGGAIRDLPTLGGTRNYAYGINDAGQVVGSSQTSSGAFRAYAYSGGVMNNLGTLGGTQSWAYATNSAGQVAGESYIAGSSKNHAFLYSYGVMHDLGTLGGDYSSARGINSRGEVVGSSSVAGSAGYHAFFCSTEGEMHDLGTLGGTYSYALGINTAGQIVGYSALSGSSYDRAFLCEDGVMIDLNSLLPAGSGWSLSRANAINELGQIVGGGTNPAGQGRAFLLTPVPEPATLALLVLGVVVQQRPRLRRCD